LEATRGSIEKEAPLREWAAKFWDKGKIVGQASTPPCLKSMIFTTKNPIFERHFQVLFRQIVYLKLSLHPDLQYD
jgi:hypothetical protein